LSSVDNLPPLHVWYTSGIPLEQVRRIVDLKVDD
jgi:hypothetical protein